MKVRQPPSITLPSQAQVEDRLLLALAPRNRPAEPVHVYRELADHFTLSPTQRHASRPNAKGSAWEYLVRQARRRLVVLGRIDGSVLGTWILTEAGREAAYKLANPPESAESIGL